MVTRPSKIETGIDSRWIKLQQCIYCLFEDECANELAFIMCSRRSWTSLREALRVLRTNLHTISIHRFHFHRADRLALLMKRRATSFTSPVALTHCVFIHILAGFSECVSVVYIEQHSLRLLKSPMTVCPKAEQKNNAFVHNTHTSRDSQTHAHAGHVDVCDRPLHCRPTLTNSKCALVH